MLQRRQCRTMLRIEGLEARCLPSYIVTDLGTLGGQSSMAWGINNAGQIVGWSQTSDPNPTMHAFLWQDGTMTDIGTLGGRNSLAWAINDAGHVAGESSTPDGQSEHAFLFDGTAMRDLGSLGGPQMSSWGHGISLDDQVIGYSLYPGGSSQEYHGFLYRDGRMIDLWTFYGRNSRAFGINNLGEVVGYAARLDGTLHAFSYDGFGLIDLGTLGGAQSFAYGINDSGQIVGESETARGAGHCFVYSDGVMNDIGTLQGMDGATCTAYATNSFRQVVGFSRRQTGAQGGFLYSDGEMIDLNEQIPPNAGVQFVSATGINDFGQIIGYGYNQRGDNHAFLLTPDEAEVPKPRDPAILQPRLLQLGTCGSTASNPAPPPRALPALTSVERGAKDVLFADSQPIRRPTQ